MSLIVWLPLTGHLNNQGLNNVTVTNVGATVDSNGKIGKCYTLDGVDDRIQIANLPNPKNVSVAFWMYRNATTNTRQFMFTAWGGVTCEMTTGNLIHCYVNGGNGACDSTYAVTADTGWIHVVYTFEDKVGGKLYLNGVLNKTASSSGSINWTTTTGNIGNYSTMYYNGKMNDFRFYDHILSLKEIKEIYKSLVVHYPLSNCGSGNSNLARNTATMPNGSGSWASGTYRNSNSGASYNQTMPTDAPFAKGIILTSSSSNTYPGFAQDSAPIKTGYLTESYYVKAPAGGKVTVQPCWKSGVSFSIVSGQASWTTTGSWQRVYCTYQVASDYDSISIAYAYFTAKTAGDVAYICGMKMEQGTKLTPTPWCPNENDAEYSSLGFNSTTVYDVSGYKNNATKTGTITFDSDAPRYSSSSYFISGSYLMANYSSPDYLPKDALTVNIWVKPTTWYNPISCTEGGGWNFEGSTIQFPVYISGVGYKVASSGITGASLQDGKWHMITGTFSSKDQQVKIYIDGVLKATTATGSSNGIGYANNRLIISGEAQSTTPASSAYVGNESDVRIYATALSQADITELYKSPAFIDKKGNVYGYELLEV